MARTSFNGPIRIKRGATVTQTTNRSTGVTINAPAGVITTDSTSLDAGAEATFTVTNSYCTATSVPVVAMKAQGAGTPVAFVTAVANGSFAITISNLHASTADDAADTINFIIFNGSNSATG
jgi:hypothetical protein